MKHRHLDLEAMIKEMNEKYHEVDKNIVAIRSELLTTRRMIVISTSLLSTIILLINLFLK